MAVVPPPVTFFSNNILNRDETATNFRKVNRETMYKIYTLMNVGFTLQTDFATSPIVPLTPYEGPFLENDRAVKGFPETGDPIKIYYCAIVYQPDRIVLAACLFLCKPASYEIWSLASNPLYLRTGAAGLLIKNICFKIWKHGFPLYLSVASDSYPFITFYDRLLFYGDLGFNCADDCVVSVPFNTDKISFNNISLKNIIAFTSYLQGESPEVAKSIAEFAAEAAKAAPVPMDIDIMNASEAPPVGDEAVKDADTMPLEKSPPTGESGVPMLIDGDSASTPPILTKNSTVTIITPKKDVISIPLYTLKTKIRLMDSIPGQRYVMGVFPHTMNRKRLLVDTLVLRGDIVENFPLLRPIYPAECESYGLFIRPRIELIKALTNKSAGGARPREYANIGIIAHSSCAIETIEKIRHIKSYTLPSNVEVITFNTLGFSTYSGTLKHAWDTFNKYLKNIPIEILKQYCPGIRPEKSGDHKYLPTPAGVAEGSKLQSDDVSFINSVKASLRYKFTDLGGPHVQINAYGPGDLIPDFNLSSEVGSKGKRSADFSTPIQGFYDSNSNIRNLNNEEIKNFLTLLEPIIADGWGMRSAICMNGIPDSFEERRSLEYYVPKSEHIDGRDYWYLQLSTFINNYKREKDSKPNDGSKEQRIRILLVGCAIVVEPSDPKNLINNRMKELTQYMAGRTIKTTMGANLASDYRVKLMAFGHMLKYRILGSLLGNGRADPPYDPARIEKEAIDFWTIYNAQIMVPGAGGYRKPNHRSKSKKNYRSKSKSKSRATRKGRR